MVKNSMQLIFLLFGTVFSIGPRLPADSTTAWCDGEYVRDLAYHCYPNPLGADRMSYWWRLPDTSKVTGCLMALVDISGAVLPTETVPVSPSTWYEQSDFGGSFAGPIAPRLSLYEDYWCSVFWGKRGKKPTLKLVPGDSILLEYKMTPRDTSVADTIWGEMNAYYLGIEDHWATDVNPYLPTSVTRKMKLSGAYVAWSHGQILLAHPETGPVLVTNLRGQILSTRTRIDGTNTWIMPASPMPPGVYRLRWPKGQSVLVVPMR